jgi:hypothetical protein
MCNHCVSIKDKISWEQGCLPVIPTLGRGRQEDGKFKASLSYLVRPFQNTKGWV